jgi:hypothetical protein
MVRMRGDENHSSHDWEAKERKRRPCIVTHACNSRYSEGQPRQKVSETPS